MDWLRRIFLLLAVGALCTGFAQRKPDITLRFHVEANAQDGERFAAPVQLKHPPRSAYIQRIPAFSERNVKAIYPVAAGDGTWGCAFKLDPSGRLALEVLSSDKRGSSLIVFVGTKAGARMVIDMLIDQRVTDGIVTIQRGLTHEEIALLRKKFPVIPDP